MSQPPPGGNFTSTFGPQVVLTREQQERLDREQQIERERLAREQAAAALQAQRIGGAQKSAEIRREKIAGRDRGIHDAKAAGKTPKQISSDSGTKINTKGQAAPALSISQVNKILAKPRP